MPRFIFPDPITGVVPINRGGTSSSTAATAVVSLGAIPLTAIGAPNGVAGLNSSGGIDPSAMGNSNAATAATLQTARTINGTSFNGSANITTTNWGTARTITIGNTGKSVDGSANVTWSLAEIGATGGGSVSIANDVVTNAVRYPAFMNANSGIATDVYVSDAKLTYNPSSGELGATTFNSLSDTRYKTNLTRIQDAILKIKNLNGYTFNYSDSMIASAGVSAQEVMSVLPCLVNEVNDRLTVNYNGLIGLLIEGMNELQAEIHELKIKIAGD